MNSKKITVSVLIVIVLAFFFFGMNAYQKRVQDSQAEKVSQSENRLVRFHSPVFGPSNASVTIVEFFDPACEYAPPGRNLQEKHLIKLGV